MKPSIFREYDIRGKVDQELIIDHVYALTQAIVYFFKEQNPDLKKVVVGRDGRSSSPEIAQQVIAALIDSGINVIDIGLCPSPVLYFVLHTQPVDAGLMITASHNPKEYNGIKISLGQSCVWGAQIKYIGQLYEQQKKIVAPKKGDYQTLDANTLYVEWLAQQFDHLRSISLKMVFDCGNAVAGVVLPTFVQKMNWQNVQILHEQVDGNFPNHPADPTVLANMQDMHKCVEKIGADVGIGFDGDADRMGVISNAGNLIAGDRLLAIFAQDIISGNPNTAVVFNVTTSAGLPELLKAWGAQSYMVPTGHAIVKETMHKTGALLGGEVSCHFFFADRYFGYDDGIYAALRFIEILHTTGKTVEELVAIFPRKYSSSEYRIGCTDNQKKAVIKAITEHFANHKDVELILVDGVRVNFTDGWFIVRGANTQPVLSIRLEGNTLELLQTLKEKLHQHLAPFLSDEQLQILNDTL